MAVPEHDWYFVQWLAYFEKAQKDVVNDLEWNKSKASLMFNGKQPYSRKDVNQVAEYLSLQPYELLMMPEDAMALRRLRREALTVVETSKKLESLDGEASAEKRDGTNG
jgi:hypothetical protein